MEVKTVCIVGLGLIGGSLAKSLKAKTPVETIYAIDSNSESVKQAMEEQIITGGIDFDSLLLQKADLVFVCTPADKVVQCIAKLIPRVKPGCILCDAASTKGEIVREVENLPDDFIFVGGHPMAGSERSGYAASNSHLFENAYFVLTPCEKSTGDAVEALSSMAQKIGALPLLLNCDEHDRAVGIVSHLPHVVAAALVNLLSDIDGGSGVYSRLAAGGFRDLTRIASSNPEMWCAITQSNEKTISELIGCLTEKLSEFKGYLPTADGKAICDFYGNAKAARDALSSRLNSLIPEVYELYVDVEDKPGIISRVATLIGDRGINIKNINISNNREETGGIMVLTLESEEQLQRALDILTGQGIGAAIRSKE